MTSTEFLKICKSGYINNLVEFINNNLDFDYYSYCDYGFRLACRVGNLDVVKYMIENFNDLDISMYNHMAFRNLCRSKNLESVKYFLSRYNIEILWYGNLENIVMEYVVENGSIDMLKYLVEHFPKTYSHKKYETLILACKNGHINIYEFLLTFHDGECYMQNELYFICYCNAGKIELAEKIYNQHDLILDIHYYELFTLKCDNIDVAKFLFDKFRHIIDEICFEKIIIHVINNCQFNILKLMISIFDIGPDIFVFNIVDKLYIKNMNHLEMLKLLRDNFSDLIIDYNIMDRKIACTRDLSIITSYFDNFQNSVSEIMMINLVGCCDCEIINHVLEKYNIVIKNFESIKKSLYESACVNSIQVMEYIENNFEINCNNKYFEIACMNNNHEILEHLLKKFPIIVITRNSIINAIRHRNYSCVKVIYDNAINIDYHDNNEYLFKLACHNGNLKIVKFFVETIGSIDTNTFMINDKICKCSLIYILCLCKYYDVLKYLTSTFVDLIDLSKFPDCFDKFIDSSYPYKIMKNDSSILIAFSNNLFMTEKIFETYPNIGISYNILEEIFKNGNMDVINFYIKKASNITEFDISRLLKKNVNSNIFEKIDTYLSFPIYEKFLLLVYHKTNKITRLMLRCEMTSLCKIKNICITKYLLKFFNQDFVTH